MIGNTVSHYRVLEKIGAGGMGVVYLAEDVRLNRKVALKFLPPAGSADPHGEARLLREAQAASGLDHPHIATVYEVGEWDGQLFIAMAYYAGDTLRRRLDAGPLPVDEAAAIARQIADGLAAAHAEGVVHRDLKPANIIITNAGQVKILDFGLAKLVSADRETALAITGRGMTLGTVAYMAPEQARGLEVDQRADIWSFGAVLYEMLTGRLPFAGDTVTAVLLSLATDEPVPLRTLRPDAPHHLEAIVTASLRKDPAARTLTAAEIARRIAEIPSSRASANENASAVAPARRRAIALGAGTGLLLAVVLVGWWVNAGAKRRWAVNEAFPEIRRLLDEQQFVAAYDLSLEARRHAPEDAALVELWRQIVRPVTVRSEPADADVAFSAYGQASWRRIGRTPLENVQVPRGVLRWRVEKAGFATAEDVTPGAAVDVALDPAASAPSGMVRVRGPRTPFQTFLNGAELRSVTFADFWIDRHEITNRQYKVFVDAGGYRKREHWQHDFVRNGRAVPWAEAVALFRDATGREGPAGWEVGAYPPGQDDFPVTGISWYEAAAYAAFAGRSLPTLYHWNWVAAHGPLTLVLLERANYSRKGPVAVGSSGTLHRFGAYDLAGNVKEWCANEAEGGKRYILGGGWDEPPYMFTDADARSPFDRARNFGFRTVKYADGNRPHEALASSIMPRARDYAREKPVSATVFHAYRQSYSYDRTPIAAAVQGVDDAAASWRRETVSFPAPYGNDRITLHLFLPKHTQPPYQTILFFPGAGAWDVRTSAQALRTPMLEFVVTSGRAMVLPILKGSFERGTDTFRSDYPKQTSVWRDHVIAWSKDVARTLDYLETRSDVAKDKIGYVGFSRGGAVAPMLLSQEPRVKVAAFWVPGFYLERMSPEVDAINFAPHMKQPTLVLSGRYDFTFPESTSQVPFFQALGTPAEHKKRIVYDAGHNLPMNEVIKETLDWFDRYLGPVR